MWLRNTAPGSSDGSAAPSRQGFQFQVAYSSCHKHIRHNVARVLLQDNANYKATQEEEEEPSEAPPPDAVFMFYVYIYVIFIFSF